MIKHIPYHKLTYMPLSDVDISSVVRAHVRQRACPAQAASRIGGRGGSGQPESQEGLYSIFSRNTRGVYILLIQVILGVALAIATVVRQGVIPALCEPNWSRHSGQNRGAVSVEGIAAKTLGLGFLEPGTLRGVRYSPDSVAT